jgi:hypothetical protein
LAIDQLPRPLFDFFFQNRNWLVRQSVAPDIRRRTDPKEGPRHFIDLEGYGDSAAWKMPLHWDSAVNRYTLDSLTKYGFVPYEVQQVKDLLTCAFRSGNKDSVLCYAADLDHYIADANVPLHTTINYDGQLSHQRGIHALWESLVPEMQLDRYSLTDRPVANYLNDPALSIWEAVRNAHKLVPQLLEEEKALSIQFPDSVKFEPKTVNGRQIQAYAPGFIHAYAAGQGAIVNQQLLRSADLIADFWLTCWVDAGKPSLAGWIAPLNMEEKRNEELELKAYQNGWLIKEARLLARAYQDNP